MKDDETQLAPVKLGNANPKMAKSKNLRQSVTPRKAKNGRIAPSRKIQFRLTNLFAHTKMLRPPISLVSRTSKPRSCVPVRTFHSKPERATLPLSKRQIALQIKLPNAVSANPNRIPRLQFHQQGQHEVFKARNFAHSRSLESIAEDLIDLSWRAWTKLILVAASGVAAGCLIALHGSDLLARLGIFVYEPDDDDDDDDEEDAEAKALGIKKHVTVLDGDGQDIGKKPSVSIEKGVASPHPGMDLSALFGDYRVTVAYNWTNADASYIALSKGKIDAAIAELDALTDQRKLEGLSRREGEIVRKFLGDTRALLDEREAELKAAEKQNASNSTSSPESGGGIRSWFRRKG
ncbi:hypothetical protein DFS34DRAFT_317441 [Phlyctochytrium arcticum]|nr:hypothetical protein DFS34DRAFT_317441 [Phlyctochytrium arcticum]